jgi:hypothetical protein
MSTTGPIVGEITQDRLTAIGGFMGRHPKRIPVRGSITTLRGRAPFAFEVVRDQALTPTFVGMGLAGALAGRVDAGHRGMMRVHSVLHAAGHPAVQLTQVYAADRDASLFVAAGMDVGRIFQALWDAPAGAPPDMHVQVDATFEADPVQESVEALYLDRTQVRVGETLEVAVRLRRPHSATQLARFCVTVPRAWAGQKISLVAAGAEAAQRTAREVGGAPQPQALADVIEALQGLRPEGHIYLMGIRNGAGLHAAVRTYAFVPPSAAVLQSGDPSREARGQGIAGEGRQARPGVVDGLARGVVRVLPL